MIDWARIDELKSEVGEDELSEVLEIFCEEVAQVLATLDHSDIDKLKSDLHFLKGSAANIGLQNLSELCAGFEAALRQEAGIHVNLSELNRAFVASTAALREQHPNLAVS